VVVAQDERIAQLKAEVAELRGQLGRVNSGHSRRRGSHRCGRDNGVRAGIETAGFPYRAVLCTERTAVSAVFALN
jgi:hypothetical protein